MLLLESEWLMMKPDKNEDKISEIQSVPERVRLII